VEKVINNEIVFMLGYITRKQWASALRMNTGLSKDIFYVLMRKVEEIYKIEIIEDVEKLVEQKEAEKAAIKRKWGE